MTNWQTKKLGDAMEFIPTGSHSRNDMMSGLSADKNAVFNIHYGDIHTKYTTYVDFDKDIVPILKENSVRSSMELQDGDLVVADASEDYAGVGSAVELRNVSERKVIGGLHTFALRSKNDEFASGFTGLILKNPATHKRLMQMSVYSKVYGLTKSSIASVDVSYPEKPEQERIVGVLEVWDEYIEKLEQKIALKGQLKKGLMQQLLTGKRRMPGFDREWITVSLGDMGYARTSSVDKLSVAGEQSVRLLNYMDVYRRDRISNSDIFQAVTAKESQIGASDLKSGDVLFTPSSETPTDIGHSAVVIEDLPMTVFSYHLMRLRMKGSYMSVSFAAYCFKTNAFYKELWKRAQGATRFTLSKDALESAKITIPDDIEEQDAIASVVKIADDEIEALKATLNEIRLQKKYLLKNLITGAIRTPEDLKPLDTTRLERSAL